MTMDAPARRLLALLLEEQAIETEPIADVRADLAALGLDPARAIAAAGRMAAGAASPGFALLGRIAEAEASDDEIRRLEQADIANVRRSLGEGATAAAIAKAQRAAGRDSNVVGLRRRRSRRLLYGLCGVAAALAASLVLVVGMSDLMFVHHSQAPPAAPASTVAPKTATDEAGDLQARMKPAGNGPVQLAEQEPAVPAAAPASADAETTTRAKSEADEKDVSQAASQPASALADAPAQSAGSVSTGMAGQSNAEELRGDALANRIAEPFGLNRPIAALLIVDPKLVPGGLKQESYPTGDLLARLGDARRLAGDRPIAALVTLRLADRTADAIVVAGATDELALRRDLDKHKTAAVASAGAGYDVILLDGR
jgi:hypothetical protein